MTSRNDRRHRLQAYPMPVLNAAINEIIYSPKDRQIMHDMFAGGLDMTYEAAGEKHGYSRTGMIKHVGVLTDKVEKHLKSKYVN